MSLPPLLIETEDFKMAVKKKDDIEVTSIDVTIPDTNTTPDVEIDTDSIKVDETNIPEQKEQNVKIRMRADHKCTIAMERYDLKAGKTYNVPENVKRILNKAGLLAPL